MLLFAERCLFLCVPLAQKAYPKHPLPVLAGPFCFNAPRHVGPRECRSAPTRTAVDRVLSTRWAVARAQDAGCVATT